MIKFHVLHTEGNGLNGMVSTSSNHNGKSAIEEFLSSFFMFMLIFSDLEESPIVDVVVVGVDVVVVDVEVEVDVVV